MLGERLRQARLAAGLSLEGLAERLERPVTKQALSKYERGLSEPPPSRIADLAAALNVRASSLLAEADVEIKWVAYRKLQRLSKSRQAQVTAVATQRLKGEVRLRGLFHLADRHDLPGPMRCGTSTTATPRRRRSGCTGTSETVPSTASSSRSRSTGALC